MTTTLSEDELAAIFFPDLQKDVSQYIRDLLINVQAGEAKESK